MTKVHILTTIFSISFVLMLSGCVSQTNGVSKDIDYEQASSTRVSLGLTYLKNGNYSQAKQNLDKALEFGPRFADAHYAMAYYFQVVGEAERATDYYKNAMRLAPKNPDIANSFGAFLCQQNQYQKAKTYFLKAVNNDRYANSAQTYENMAICAENEGFSDDAIGYLRSALNYQPGRVQSLMLLAELHAKNENYSEAQKALDTIERYGRIDANVLWLRMDIFKRQGLLQEAQDYGTMLTSVYPNSELAKRYSQNPVRLTPIASASADESPNPDDTPAMHVVKDGENLFRISVLYNIAMRRLIEWNNLDESGSIKTGMTLRLMPPQSQPPKS